MSGDSQTRQMSSGESVTCLSRLIGDRMNKFLLADSVVNKGEMSSKMYSPVWCAPTAVLPRPQDSSLLSHPPCRTPPNGHQPSPLYTPLLTVLPSLLSPCPVIAPTRPYPLPLIAALRLSPFLLSRCSPSYCYSTPPAQLYALSLALHLGT